MTDLIRLMFLVKAPRFRPNDLDVFVSDAAAFAPAMALAHAFVQFVHGRYTGGSTRTHERVGR